MAPSVVQFLGVFLLNLCITSSSGQYFDPFHQIEQAHDYLRSADVSRHCQPVLSAAAELTYDPNRSSRMKRELSFEKGDWLQDVAGHAPLLPFNGSDAAPRTRSGGARWSLELEPLSLATFVVTHVDDEEHRARAGRAVNVSGVLLLTVSRKSVAPVFGRHVSAVSPEFNISAGSTRLKILFEGLYTERATGNGDGERVLCMVGTAVLPTRSTDGPDPWDWAGNSGRSSFQSRLTAVDSILLVLQYPKELTLTTRAVLGEMWSTSASSDAAYFDTVQLMSAFTDWNCMYQFRPEEVVAGSRNALASSGANDVVSNRAREMYSGSYPCDVLRRFADGQVSTVLPGWHCRNATTATGASCRSLGPFEMDREADADVLARAGIMMQDLQCRQQQGYDMAGTPAAAFVSVVFRALPPWEDWQSAYQRSGLSGKTLSAEGVWDASTGPACMVACRGTPAGGDKACNFRVCLYFPATISITGQDTMLGQITGVGATGGVAQPSLLSFQQHMRPPRLWGYFPDDGRPLLTYKYNYTKVNRAGELLRRNESPSYFRKINPISPALCYPRRDGTGDSDDRKSLSTLANTLTLCFPAVPSLFIPPEWIENPILNLEIFSIEQLIDRYVPSRSGLPRKEHASEWHSLLNVSAELTISNKLIGSSSSLSSVVSLEGVYNQEDGRMYLIGCRNVKPQRSSSSTRRDLDLELGLEDGMDCSIEVIVEYPPTTMYWFIRSTAKVKIASTRKATDPLHFDMVKLKVLPIIYPKQQPGGYYRGIANGVLCIVLLSATIAAALSQLSHLKSHADVAPYVSLVMLGVQALGYAMPLVAGIEAAEALLARVTFLGSSAAAAMAPSSSRTPSYMFGGDLLFQTIHLTVKILTLVAFVLTLRLGHKVRWSRARMLARSPLDPARVPSVGRVFAYHLAIFLAILALSRRAVAVEEHVGQMQDLFLLPQAIGNVLWRVNCRPLKGSFYAGVTAVRLLPHVYDYVRPPTPAGSSYYSGGQEPVNASGGRFFARGGDVVIPLAAVALALVVHVQQRWNYAIVSRMCKAEQKKLQHIF